MHKHVGERVKREEEIQSLTRMFHEKIQEKENKPKKKSVEVVCFLCLSEQ